MLEGTNQYIDKLSEYAKLDNAEVVVICAKIESDLGDMSDEEKNVFLNELGVAESGLDKLSENFDYNVIKNIIEFKYLDYLGITPDLTICHKCYERKKFYAIDGKIGGFVCKDCYQNERLVSEKFSAILNRFRDVDINEIKEIKISDENKNIVNEFLSEYYSSFSAIYLNSEKFLKPFE